MSTWLFAIVVLLIGVCFAYYIDRMKVRPGSGPAELKTRSERAKWIYYWYTGRFPEQEEHEADDEQAKREAEEGRNKEAKLNSDERRGQ